VVALGIKRSRGASDVVVAPPGAEAASRAKIAYPDVDEAV
jgi:hypothetical protein